MKIYVASSWRNLMQPGIVVMLRKLGHEVYDFKNPAAGNAGFHWSEIDGGWQDWTIDQYRSALTHPVAESGFKADFDAMEWADVCVLVLPSGRSSHLEAGWFIGQGKPTCIYLVDAEPELMNKMASALVTDPHELFDWLDSI